MANYRNEFEFRSGLLDALGVEHSEADAKNEERWRAKMLDGLGVEYNQNDVNQFDLFRAKLVEGVENYSGGGDSGSWQTVFEGSVTTVEDSVSAKAPLDVEDISADTIKVTFNGTEYTCNKNGDGTYGDIELIETPFSLDTNKGTWYIFTQTAGTYTLKIEEEQSGGGDFSTAEVTLINNYGGVEISLIAPTYVDSEEISTSINYITAQPNETITQNAFLYKNSCFAEIRGFELIKEPVPTVTVSGNVVYEGDGFFTITGDCTITIS